MIRTGFQMNQLVIPPHTYNEETDQCLICMRMLVSPQQCLTCKSRFCTACVRKWRTIKNTCPKRCSTRWRVRKIPKLPYKLTCPFKCELALSPEQFAPHLKICPNHPKNSESQESRKTYQCYQNHTLQFLSKICNEDSKCKCGEYARSFCWACAQDEDEGAPVGFCCQCRPPPALSRDHCPLQHKYKLVDGPLFTSIVAIYCDLCNRIIPHNKGCYNDRTCHFAVCLECHSKLPQENGPVSESSTNPMIPSAYLIQGGDWSDNSPDYVP